MSQVRKAGSPSRREGERGFTLLQTLIVVSVVVILTVISVNNFASVRQRVMLNNAALEVTRYLEKTRTDSIKRHAASTAQARVTVLNANSYAVVMDFNGDGNITANETRTVLLPTGITFNVTPSVPPAVSYDWRGRPGANNRITLASTAGDTINIDLSGGGDITSNGATLTLPTISSTPYPTPVTAGSTSTPTPSPSPSPPMPSGAPECYVDTDVTSITVRKSGLTTGYVNITQDQYGKGANISIIYDSTELSISPNTASLESLGSIQIAIKDIKGGSKDYTTTFTIDHPCGQKVITVLVTN
jgi:Tfp pilus assembly protein FimT